MSNNKLQKAIQFTKDDLYMNRQSKLTPAQVERLKNGMFDPSKWNKFIVGIMIGGFILLLGRNGLEFLTVQSILWYSGICIALFFIYSLYFKGTAKKLEEGKYPVEKLEGVVLISSEEKKANPLAFSHYGGVIGIGEKFSGINLGENAFVIEIGGKKLYTNKQIQEAFENGKKYAVFILRMSQQEYQNALVGAVIVSAEPLGGIEDDEF